MPDDGGRGDEIGTAISLLDRKESLARSASLVKSLLTGNFPGNISLLEF